VGYIGAKVTVEIQKPEPDKPDPTYSEKYFLPHLIAYSIGVASVAVFVVCLLRWDDFTTNPEKIENWGKSIDSCKFAVVTGSFIVLDFLYKYIIFFLQELGIADAMEAKVKLAEQNLDAKNAKDELTARLNTITTDINMLNDNLPAQILVLKNQTEKLLINLEYSINTYIKDNRRLKILDCLS
jgi:hypothetical protein